MELDGSGQEVAGHLEMQRNGRRGQVHGGLLYGGGKVVLVEG